MRKIIFNVIFVSFFSFAAFTQNFEMQLTPEERAQMQTEWMKENLKLNDSQLVKVEALNLEFALKMEKVKGIDGQLSQIKEARAISEEKDEKLKQIMDEGQFETYLKKRRELWKKMNEIRKGE